MVTLHGVLIHIIPTYYLLVTLNLKTYVILVITKWKFSVLWNFPLTFCGHLVYPFCPFIFSNVEYLIYYYQYIFYKKIPVLPSFSKPNSNMDLFQASLFKFLGITHFIHLSDINIFEEIDFYSN